MKLSASLCKKLATIFSSYTAYSYHIVAHSPGEPRSPRYTLHNTLPRDIYSSYCLILVEHFPLQENALTVWPLGEPSTFTQGESRWGQGGPWPLIDATRWCQDGAKVRADGAKVGPGHLLMPPDGAKMEPR